MTATTFLRRTSACTYIILSCLFLSGCEKSDERPNEKSADRPSETLQADSISGFSDDLHLDADLGPWRGRLITPGEFAPTSADTVGITGGAAIPVASTAFELQAHMLGPRLNAELSIAEIEETVLTMFQKIPGVPLGPRYEHPRFDEVRDAFTSDCTNAVQDYQRSLITALSARQFDFEKSLLTIQRSRIASSYENECLTTLANVPLAIRRVVGILVVDQRPFCSATIVAQKSLLTSRHCFVDQDSGEARTTLSHWRDGNVNFVPAVAQNFRSAFSVAPPDAAELQAIKNPFDVSADYLRLSTIRSMQYAAEYRAAPAQMTQYPVTAWLVGSNIHLDDIGAAGAPLDFVRGASPNACALLEKTAAGCVYHTCQSSPSTSGAGVLTTGATGNVELLAVHKGTIAEAETCETSPPRSLQLNLAISDIDV